MQDYIELASYRNKGINAYLSPTDTAGKGIMAKNMYGMPKDDAEKQKAFKGKKHLVHIELKNLPDGKYIYKEASGADFNKARYGWLVLKDGEIVTES